MTRTHTVFPARRVEGELAVPGDKSISHRALLVAGVGTGTMAISGLSPAEDVARSRMALEALGVRTRSAPIPGASKPQVEGSGRPPSGRASQFQVLVDGAGWEGLREPERPIDVGNSGTTIRLLLGILAGSRVEATLTGDESIRRRPMGRVVVPLRRMGARIDGADDGDRAPLHVRGGPLVGAAHELDVASAQVKSALLLAGLRAAGRTSVAEPGPSRDHTERLLRYLGIPIRQETGRLIVESTEIRNDTLTVPGDLSSAAFLLVAAAVVPGSRIVVHDVGVNPTRAGILDVLRAFGAAVDVSDERERCGEPVATVSVAAADRRPVQVAGALTVRTIDELPLVAVLAAYADGESVVADAAELRVKESDRIAALAEGLGRMGVPIEATPDGFVVRGGRPLHGAPVRSFGDHRIAMALAVAALGADGPTTIEGWDAVAVSYPRFEEDLAALVR